MTDINDQSLSLPQIRDITIALRHPVGIQDNIGNRGDVLQNFIHPSMKSTVESFHLGEERTLLDRQIRGVAIRVKDLGSRSRQDQKLLIQGLLLLPYIPVQAPIAGHPSRYNTLLPPQLLISSLSSHRQYLHQRLSLLREKFT